jgi:hypothetical protein
MERSIPGEALDRQDRAVLGVHDSRHAAPERLAVDEHRAGAADALAAARLRTGDVEVVAQDLEEASVRVARDLPRDPVDDQPDRVRTRRRLHVRRLRLLRRRGPVAFANAPSAATKPRSTASGTLFRKEGDP